MIERLATTEMAAGISFSSSSATSPFFSKWHTLMEGVERYVSDGPLTGSAK